MSLSTMSFSTISTYLKLHEKLVFVILAIFTLWMVCGKVENVIAAHDQSNLTSQQQVLKAQTDKTATLAQEAQQQAAQLATLNSQITLQNQALQQANTVLIANLTKQQAKIAVMTPPQVISRWAALVPSVNFTGSPITADGSVSVTPDNAKATVETLEQVPVLQAELTNVTTERDGLTELSDKDGLQIGTLDEEITSLNLQLVDQKKTDAAELAVVKAQARKSKRHYFIAGFVAGIATRLLLKF